MTTITKNCSSETIQTLNYYNQNARIFSSSTADVEFNHIQDRFASALPFGAKILDFGCGSGRDTKYFLSKGFHVEATDGSEELCKIAAEYAGIPVRHELFQDLNETEAYQGIWACSSILHLPKSELSGVLQLMSNALVPGGVIYTSFKYGSFEGLRNGRYFTDFTLENFAEFIGQTPSLTIREHWISGDVRPNRENEQWLNLLLQKSPR